MNYSPDPERTQAQIQKVLSTIWHETGRLQCPVCATPMAQGGMYNWYCPINFCPVDDMDFNTKIHNYDVTKSLSHDYKHKSTRNRY